MCITKKVEDLLPTIGKQSKSVKSEENETTDTFFPMYRNFYKRLLKPIANAKYSTLKLKKKLNSSTFKVEYCSKRLLQPIANEENRVSGKVEYW